MIHSDTPNIKPDGKMFTKLRLGSSALIVAKVSCRPPKPPTLPRATTQRMVEPTIMTVDWAASVQIDALMPPA